MSNLSNVQVEIFDSSDVSQGTITRLLSFRSTGELDMIGDGEFTIALDDTQSVSLVTRNHIAVISGDTSRRSGIGICHFIIQNISKSITPDGRAILTVAGPEISYEWTYTNLGYTVIDDGAGGEAAFMLDTILTTFDPSIGGGWRLSFDNVDGWKYSGYFVASGESAWDAITSVGPTRDVHYSHSNSNRARCLPSPL